MNIWCSFWTDEERDLILAELSKPLSYSNETTTDSLQRRAGHREFLYVSRCHALFPIVWLQLLWGVRPREACMLTVGNWDSCTRELHVPTVGATSGKERRFIVDQVTARILDTVAKERGLTQILFRNACGQPWHPRLLSLHFGSVLRRLRLRGSLFSLRRDAIASLLKAMPGDVAAVMAITGHPSLDLIDLSVRPGTRGRAVGPVDNHATPPPTPPPYSATAGR